MIRREGDRVRGERRQEWERQSERREKRGRE